MSVLQDRGRMALAGAFAAKPIYLAWGRGLPAWDAEAEPEPTTDTALVAEIGRRLVTAVQFVLADPAGEIELPDGSRFKPSAARTQWVHVRWTFDYADAAGETVRELGIFLDSTPAAGLPAGQRYFVPAQIAGQGDLYTLQRVGKFTRDGGVRQSFEWVVPF